MANAGLKQRRSPKDRLYYAAQFGRTTANKNRRAARVKRRKFMATACVSAPLPPRKTSKARRSRRLDMAIKAHDKKYPRPGGSGVNVNASNAPASTILESAK